jgi:hypothetical protein
LISRTITIGLGLSRVACALTMMAAAAGDGGGAVVDEFERPAKLHERGALTDDEYAPAKRMLL